MKKANDMRIIQITDIHVGAEGEVTRDVDVRGNFVDMLRLAADLQPDYLVFSGDLCYSTADAENYRWIRAQIEQLALPYDIIPGNHDETKLMAKAFDRTHLLLPGGEMAFERTMSGFRFLFLDTSTAVLSSAQAEWLSARLESATRRQIIFMHHPPLKAGVPFMDNNYPLQHPEVFLEVANAYPNHPIHVFCGHYHVEKTVHAGHLHVHVTPSTFFQIDGFRADFGIDHYRPGMRVIDLSEQGTFMHSVKYLDVAGW